MYEPSSGSIYVDETPLARVNAAEWRLGLAGAFQDFFRFEFHAAHTVGLGDVPRLDDEAAVRTAVDRAGAADVVTSLESVSYTHLDVYKRQALWVRRFRLSLSCLLVRANHLRCSAPYWK